MRTEPDRCSARSARLGESLSATASTVSTWILLEQPGPWGRDALTGSRLPDGLGRRLRRLAGGLGARIVLIRRYGRDAAEGGTTCFLAHTGPERAWLERASLSGPGDLLDLDLSGLRRGQPPGVGAAESDPLFVVCTHGRRDPCCAERGRPVARALDRTFGDRAWETSHIGGDRFAGNLLCFPHGAYFGRLDPASGVDVAEAYARGRLILEHYRGRSCYPFAVQAAEMEVRTRLGLNGVDALGPTRWRRPEPAVTEASFSGPDGSGVVVTVRAFGADPPRVLTCHGEDAVRPPAYRIESFELRSRPRP